MDRTEKAFAIFLEIKTILVFSVFTVKLTGLFTGLLVSFVIAHTINWLFNGQVFQLFKNLGFTKISRRRFIEYSIALQRRVAKQGSLSAAAIFGSLARGELKESSDLDVRIIRRSGTVNGVKACTFTFLERTRAFLHGFPLDVCTFDSLRSLSKLKSDESPIILYDPDKKFVKSYQRFLFFDEIVARYIEEKD